MIEEYYFGLINVDGKKYTYDVEVRWNGEVLSWWRKEGHLIKPEDIKRAIEMSPELIIIGRGEAGVAEVSKETKEEILSKGIKLIIEKTTSAVKIFNDSKAKGEKVIGLFHLTC